MCALMGTTGGCQARGAVGSNDDWPIWGLGRVSPALSGAPVDAPGAGGAVAITGGYAHTCALMSSPHAAKCWGWGERGAAGATEKDRS